MAEELYFATLVNGQVYYFSNQRFDKGNEVEVDKNAYRYLRTLNNFETRTTAAEEEKPVMVTSDGKVNLDNVTAEELEKKNTHSQLDHLALEELEIPEDEYVKSGSKKEKAEEILDFWNAQKETNKPSGEEE